MKLLLSAKSLKRFILQSRNERGFTLIELLTVLIIIAILAGISAPVYMNYVKGARAAEAQTTISAINTAAKVYYQKYGEMPTGIEDLERTKELQIDPATKQKWAFDLQPAGEQVGEISATSTEEMQGGAGKVVRYDPKSGKFSGWSIDD